MPSVFSPLAKALLDGFSEGVVVFDIEGRVLYANQPAREALAGMDLTEAAPDLLPRLAALGGRLRPLRVSGIELGEAMFVPGIEGPTTLAAREKEAIVKTLESWIAPDRERDRRPMTSTRRSFGRCHWTWAICSSTAERGTRAHRRRPTLTPSRYRTVAR